jgi:predicted DNA-binding protein (UPF0251 family)
MGICPYIDKEDGDNIMRMGRPPRCRRVGFLPQITYFKPAGKPLSKLEEVSLSVEEIEAIRLKDLEGLEQEECAEKMNISRTTFQRLLGSARQNIAQALLNGSAIKIGGGNFEMAMHRYRCLEGHEWDISFDVGAEEAPEVCPTCNTASIAVVQLIGRGPRWRGTGRHGRGRDRK